MSSNSTDSPANAFPQQQQVKIQVDIYLRQSENSGGDSGIPYKKL
jgi:hypothetical protein